MHTTAIAPTSAPDLKAQLQALQRERGLAGLTGLLEVAAYRRDLEEELAATEAAYVGAAVSEIASLRAALNGPLKG